MLYDAKLEPPKFNPDLASLNSGNNGIVPSGSSVTLTPVSSFSSTTSEKSFSATNNDSSKTERFFNSDHKSKEDKKTPNVVVKIGKHGETYHAKKEEIEKDIPKEKDPPADSSVEKVPNNHSKPDSMEIDKRSVGETKDDQGEKKGFTNANFVESYVTQSVSVTAALIKSDKEQSPPRKINLDFSSIKVEAMDVDSTVSLTSSISSTNSTGKSRTSSKDSGVVLETVPSSKPYPDTANSLSESVPQSKTNHKDLLSSTYMFDSGNPVKPSSSSLYSRSSLSSSVSLFPTNSTSSHKPITEQVSLNSVSITPAIPSTISSSSSATLSKNELLSSGKTSIIPVNQPVTISPINSTDKVPDLTPLESPNQPNSAVSPRSANGLKRPGRPPKKGTHIASNTLAWLTVEDNLDASSVKRLKTEDNKSEEKPEPKDMHRLMMFGATLNPASGMAKEMTSVLQV